MLGRSPARLLRKAAENCNKDDIGRLSEKTPGVPLEETASCFCLSLLNSLFVGGPRGVPESNTEVDLSGTKPTFLCCSLLINLSLCAPEADTETNPPDDPSGTKRKLSLSDEAPFVAE